MISQATEPLATEASPARASRLRLALITPARNEEQFIELAIKSVIAQSVRPVRWVIVSDGSTDRTGEIVQQYASQHDWIDYVSLPERRERHFAGKVEAFNAGYERLRGLNYDVIGSMDGDISFDDADYFAFLLTKFEQDPHLGIAGAPFREGNVQYNYRFSRKEHVSGACQLFRRQCFESIGGYIPLRMGAVDLAANVTARMKGWTTQTFPEKFCIHHRHMGSAKDHVVMAMLKSGYGDYRVGVHPLWQLFRCGYQMSRKPIFIGGFLLLVGYFWAMITRVSKPVSAEFVIFRRNEQKQWLRDYFRRLFRLAPRVEHHGLTG